MSFIVFWLAARTYDAMRGDFFYLADAFLQGRTWLTYEPGSADVVVIGGRVFVPFAPFPAIAFMPLVALVGPVTADQWEPGINAALAAAAVGLCWWLLGRVGVPRRIDRVWLTLLFGFSTQILWVTMRGGVWHSGHLIATILTFGCLLELWGARRAWLVGLLAGAAFLTRAPLAFAIPFYAFLLVDWHALVGRGARLASLREWLDFAPIRGWAILGSAIAPSVAFFFWYNLARFGTPFESGYALAVVPPFLEAQRQLGLFSLAHVPMNLDYFLLHLPEVIDRPPYLRPDGLGLSVLLTSPGLLYALRAQWRSPRALLLGSATIAVLAPSLLYYGGGWLQYGYRYFLDSIPFVMALCAMTAATRGRIGMGWKLLIIVGVLVMAVSVYWAHRM